MVPRLRAVSLESIEQIGSFWHAEDRDLVPFTPLITCSALQAYQLILVQRTLCCRIERALNFGRFRLFSVGGSRSNPREGK
jgi:hypothetical protein